MDYASCVFCVKMVLMFSCPSHTFLYFRFEVVSVLHSLLVCTETLSSAVEQVKCWAKQHGVVVRMIIDGCLVKKGVREEEEDNVVIPLCKETKSLKHGFLCL